MKIKIEAYQKFGKPVKEPISYEFCCWQSLLDWLNSVNQVYRCSACASNMTGAFNELSDVLNEFLTSVLEDKFTLKTPALLDMIAVVNSRIKNIQHELNCGDKISRLLATVRFTEDLELLKTALRLVDMVGSISQKLRIAQDKLVLYLKSDGIKEHQAKQGFAGPTKSTNLKITKIKKR